MVRVLYTFVVDERGAERGMERERPIDLPPARPPDRPAITTEEESVNDGSAEGSSMANAASADTTVAKRHAAARVDAAKILTLLSSPFWAMERDETGRALGPMVAKAAEEPTHRAAAVRSRVDFMV